MRQFTNTVVGQKIPNPSTQITNNIQIRKSNDLNILVAIYCLMAVLLVLNFEFWSLVFI